MTPKQQLLQDYLKAGFSPTPYESFKALRASCNSPFTEFRTEEFIHLTSSYGNLRLVTVLDLTATTDLAEVRRINDYTTTMAPLAGLPIERDEVRFETHDFADKRAWDGRTTGDPAAWVAGGAARHPATGNWVDSAGNPISAVYDDVVYRWLSPEGEVLAWLDQGQGLGDATWKSKDGGVLVRYEQGEGDPRDGEWVRMDVPAGDPRRIVTSSRFSIVPYPGYKVQINEAWLSSETGVIFNGVIQYRAYSYVPEGHPMLKGMPGGIYPVKTWDYPTLAVFLAGANVPPLPPIKLPGRATEVITIGYDYGKTMPPVLDSLAAQRLDIQIDNHRRMQGTKSATATFVALKIRSF